MTKLEVEKNGKYLGETAISGPLYNGYEGSKKYYLLESDVYEISTCNNSMEYVGKSETVCLGSLVDLLAEEEHKEQMLLPEYFDRTMLDILKHA